MSKDKKPAKPQAKKPRYYVRIQEEFVDLRTNPKPGHSYVWLIERDGAANEGRLNGCMLTQSAEALAAWLESLGVEVQRVKMPAGTGLHVGDRSDKDLAPEVTAERCSKNLPGDVEHGIVQADEPPVVTTSLDDLVSDLL